MCVTDKDDGNDFLAHDNHCVHSFSIITVKYVNSSMHEFIPLIITMNGAMCQYQSCAITHYFTTSETVK